MELIKAEYVLGPEMFLLTQEAFNLTVLHHHIAITLLI